MAYSTETMARARARLAQAKENRESENRQHLLEAYEKVPRLREIDRQLRQTMAMAFQATFTQGVDVQQTMEQVKQQNLGPQQERERLVALHFEEGYLDDSPICDRCGGNGYIGSTMCECLAELCRQEQKKELTMLNVGRVNFDQFVLDYYPDRIDPKLGVNIRSVMEKNYQYCRQFAMRFNEWAPSMLFSGDTGLGKTFLAACIARTVADKGYSVVYESATHLFNKLEKARFSEDEQALRDANKYCECDLLIIDDLGTEVPGQFVTSSLYTLINDRLQYGKSTIISTNLRTDELDYRYSPQIASRLRGNYKRIAFLGDDIRTMKAW